jgi:hypothetical protein
MDVCPELNSPPRDELILDRHVEDLSKYRKRAKVHSHLRWRPVLCMEKN